MRQEERGTSRVGPQAEIPSGAKARSALIGAFAGDESPAYRPDSLFAKL
jgi:hypothetical protein